MRNWGIAVTSFYVFVVLILLTPWVWALAVDQWHGLEEVLSLYTLYFLHGGAWIWAVTFIGSQALLLFLSVDTSFKRLKPRQHVSVSIALAAFMFAVLTLAAISSLMVVLHQKPESDQWAEFFVYKLLYIWAALWVPWTVFFYLYFRESLQLVNRLASWLLRGSVLELLIAVPCHLIVRQRDDCSAPVMTGFGIVTGIAIMLLSFGPSVLFLYKKRLDQYKKRTHA